MLSLLLLSPLFLSACKSDPVSLDDPQDPIIEEIQFPPTTYLNKPGGTQIHFRVVDPQGVSNIASATLLVIKPGESVETEVSPWDDGQNGDIIAADGQFTAVLDADFWGQAGDAQFKAFAVDSDGNSVTSELQALVVQSGDGGQMPEIKGLAFPDTINPKGSYEINLLTTVVDPDGVGDIDTVFYQIFPPQSLIPSLEGQLFDDGQNDDGIAGNGIFGMKLQNTIFGDSQGIFTLRLQAKDKVGNVSHVRIKYFLFSEIIVNQPPVLLSASLPETISRSSANPLILRATVADSNGLSDIDAVLFNSFKPDGSPASGNPFRMRNDGQNGDATAGDDEYALTIFITTANATGTYTFSFFARDKSGLTSNVIELQTVVVE